MYSKKTVSKKFKFILNGQKDSFDTARCQLPNYNWITRDGFTDEKMQIFDQLMHSNAHLFYKYGTNGYISNR